MIIAFSEKDQSAWMDAFGHFMLQYRQVSILSILSEMRGYLCREALFFHMDECLFLTYFQQKTSLPVNLAYFRINFPVANHLMATIR